MSLKPRALIAYDPGTGAIRRAHFGLAPASAEGDPLLDQLGRLLAEAGPAEIVEVSPDDMKPGRRYRVDPATRRLVEASPGERGFAAASGFAKPSR